MPDYITFPGKIKEVFSGTGGFFQKILEADERGEAQPHSRGECPSPKFPHRAQRARQYTVEEHQAAGGSENHVAPQFAIGGAEQEREKRGGQGGAVEEVEKTREAWEEGAEGAEDIVERPGGKPQQDGLEELYELARDEQFHG